MTHDRERIMLAWITLVTRALIASVGKWIVRILVIWSIVYILMMYR